MDDFNIVLVIVIGVVILLSLALWRGRGMRIRRDKDGSITLETDAAQPEKAAEQNIIVGENLEIEDATTGDIAGIKGGKVDSSTDTSKNIEVLKGGKVKKSDTGDIVGIKQKGKSDKEKK